MFTTIRRLLTDHVLQWGPHPHDPQGPHWGGGPHGGSAGGMTAIGGGDAFLSLVYLFALLALLALVAYALYRNLEGSSEEPADDAVTALRTRYARGDVDDDEFERRYARLTRESS